MGKSGHRGKGANKRCTDLTPRICDPGPSESRSLQPVRMGLESVCDRESKREREREKERERDRER